MTTARKNDTFVGLKQPVVVHAGAVAEFTSQHASNDSGSGGGGGGVMSERLIITIDGPAGTGKSTVARALAHRLGLDFLDTGAMYRAAAAIAIDLNIDLADSTNVPRFVSEVERADLHFDFDTDPPTLLARGESIVHRLRDADVTRMVSPVAGIARLRQEMVQKQRQIAMQHPRLVTEGRDQGSVVFPDADVKFYMFASARVRAERRDEQLRASGRVGGGGNAADIERLEQEIIARDRSDTERTVGPLTCPADAERLDTSDIGFDQVVDALEAHVKRTLGSRLVQRSRQRAHRSA